MTKSRFSIPSVDTFVPARPKVQLHNTKSAMTYHFPTKLISLRVICMSLFLSALVLMSGCEGSKSLPVAAVPSASSQRATTVAKPTGRRLSLTIAGYNYTNRYIDDFRVDGQWGGNLSVSVPGSRGGGSVCCFTYFDTDELEMVKVRWQSGACYFTRKSSFSDDTEQGLHSFFKEVEVQLDKSRARKPNYLEVHFYPDGTVKTAVTDATSTPLMTVDPANEDRSTFPRCPNDQKPL
jgi:hypothetical protein